MKTLNLSGVDVPLNAPALGFKIAQQEYGLDIEQAMAGEGVERVLRFVWLGWLAVHGPTPFDEFESTVGLEIGMVEILSISKIMRTSISGEKEPGKPKTRARRTRAPKAA